MSTRITVSLPEAEYLALSEVARQYDVSLSWLTRKAVAEFLSAHGTKQRPAEQLTPGTQAVGIGNERHPRLNHPDFQGN